MKTLIAIPCLNMLPVEFMCSMLNLRKTEETSYAVNINSLIYDSRNGFCATALQKGYDRVLWLDSDMTFEPDLLTRLSADMDTGKEYVAALAFKRRIPTGPVIYKRLDYLTDGEVRAIAEPYLDYPRSVESEQTEINETRSTLFRIAGSGFGGVLVSCDLIRRVWDRFGPPFEPMVKMGEDLAFCWRARQLGAELWCDSAVKMGHVGTLEYNEDIFLRQQKSTDAIQNDGAEKA